MTPSRSALWRWLVAPVGFWPALGKALIVCVTLYLLGYLLAATVGSPWFELFSFASFGAYVLPAWWLTPGRGSLLRRGARVLAWAIVAGLLLGVISWLTTQAFTYPRLIYGIPGREFTLSLWVSVLNGPSITLSLFVPTRAVLTLWRAGRARLRWQLTASHLLVGVLTTILFPVAVALFFGVASLFIQSPFGDAGDTARRASEALAPLVRQGAPPDQLAAALRGMLDGSAHVPASTTQPRPPDDSRPPPDPSFTGISRLALLHPDGSTLASAGDLPNADAALQPGSLAPLLAAAQAGGCAEGRPAYGELVDTGACVIRDARGTPIATLVVWNNVEGMTQWGVAVVRIISLVAFSLSIALSSMLVAIFALLLLAFGVGYLLARRLTRRLERLAAATDGLAAGDLARRVEVDSPDEVGRLSDDFNRMAARLAERERALAAAAARAEALLSANRRLVANVSHELRTPLATLRGYLEALEQDHGDQLPARDMAVIQGEVQRLTTLIDDLFTLARAEAQQLPLAVETVDTAALARRLVDTLAPLARRERQIEVVAALPDGLPPVRADRARLEQVLLNLLQNALRHTPPGGIVAIEGRAIGDGESPHVTLTVADTGVGIPADELPLVFERFYRSDSSRARETGGAGLGLALVKELVVAMGGSVAVESQPGRGSRFSVTLGISDCRL